MAKVSLTKLPDPDRQIEPQPGDTGWVVYTDLDGTPTTVRMRYAGKDGQGHDVWEAAKEND